MEEIKKFKEEKGHLLQGIIKMMGSLKLEELTYLNGLVAKKINKLAWAEKIKK